MKCVKWILLSGIVASVGVASAFDVVLQNADGSAFKENDAVRLEVTRTAEGAVETVRCRLTACADGVRMLRLTASDELAGVTTIWDGQRERPRPAARVTYPLYQDFAFLLGAVWKPGEGFALGTGAEDFNSHADAIFEGDRLSVSVHATLLRKGATYTCTFHRLAFDPKYGIRDALAHYYPLYPKRFYRNPDVTPGFYGICAEYGSWREADPESCRLMNATWEWCHGSDRVWGDLLSAHAPTGKPNTAYCWVEPIKYVLRDGQSHRLANSRLTREEFDQQVDARLANAYYCGVANGFYTMFLANISNAIAADYPDSVAVGNTLAKNDYFYSADVFTFPECSWGVEARRQLAELVRRRDLGGLAFDVSRARAVYRGERLKEMTNVSWDTIGPGVVRGIGSAKLFEYIRTLPNKRLPGKTAVSANSFYEHISDLLYLDMAMHERTPWDIKMPFPLQGRIAMGEKGLTIWEGYTPRSFDPNYNHWPEEERHMLVNDLAHFAIHRSFLTGASLPKNFICEYASRMSHAFIRMNDAGWKPVPGAQARGANFDLARYGLGDRSYLAVCNLTNAARRAVLDVFPQEIETGLVGAPSPARGFLFAPFFGGETAHRFRGNESRVSVPIAPLGVSVLEAVARADGQGTIFAGWSGDGCGTVRLTLRSKDYAGKVICRAAFENYRAADAREMTLRPGETVTLDYRDPTLAPIADAIAALDLSDLAKVRLTHGSGSDARDMAERIAYFFRALTQPVDRKKAAKHVSPVAIGEDAALGNCTVALGNCRIEAADRVAFSRLIRRAINVLNVKRYPAYGASPKMEGADCTAYPLVRY